MSTITLENTVNPYRAPETLDEDYNEGFYDKAMCGLKHVFIPGYSFYSEYKLNKELSEIQNTKEINFDAKTIFDCAFFEFSKTYIFSTLVIAGYYFYY